MMHTALMRPTRLWRYFALSCAAWLGLASASARADDASAPNPHRWLFLPVFAGPLPPHVSVAHLSSSLEAGVRDAQESVLNNSDAAVRFETIHSAEPVELNNDELTRLLQNVSLAARHLALGELPLAQQAMEGVYALSGPARDYLNREAERARKIFDTCLMTSYLWERDHNRAQSLRQMLECSRSFPGFRPEGRAYPPELREVFELARQQLNQSPATTLLVNSTRSCGVRLNGIQVGKSPMSFSDVRTGITRVQLECQPNVAGRIHTVELHPGKNRLDIDAGFDAAVHSRGALWLSYPDEAQRQKRMLADATTIARALGTTRLVTLLVDGETDPDVRVQVQFGPHSELDTLSFSTSAAYSPPAVAAAVSNLLAAAGRAPQQDESPEVGNTTIELDGPVVATMPTPPPTAIVQPQRHDSTLNEQMPILGVALALTGGVGLATSWVFYARRHQLRTAPVEGELNLTKLRSFNERGAVTLTLGSFGTLLLSLSNYFWLPNDHSVPTWSWVVAGFGTAVGLTGLAFALSGPHCGLHVEGEVFQSGCSRFTADSTFGPLLALHALPLLSMPLAYALRIWLRPSGVDVTMDITSQAHTLGLTVRGAL